MSGPAQAARAPRRFVHRGVVEAAGVLVDEALAGPGEARRRVVAAWEPGASVHRVGAAILVRFAAPRYLDCARAPGLPLVRAGRGPDAPLASAPLAADELAALAPPPGAVVLVRAGAVTAVVPAEAQREDPATYLDVAAFAVVRPEPLGAPPPAPRLVAVPTNVAPRALLGVGAAPAAQSGVAAALAALAAGGAPPAGAGGPGPARAGALGALARAFAASLGALLGLLLRRGATPPALPASTASAAARGLAAAPTEPAGPSLRERLAARLSSLLADLLVRSRLAHLVGRRQAEYLERLLDMLDRGDLDAALRHAIPLRNPDGTDSAPSAPALGVPTPRSDLAISLGTRGPRTAMAAATDFYAHLRARYRALFEKLEGEGRFDEAAFVLAELLQEATEAVSFLERHGRLRLAAELAEARSLPPGLQVRQWFLAGDAARAVRIARRHGAFADALARLDRHEGAPALRALWAETLAEAGDFAAAVDAIWPVETARPLAAAWIDRAVAQGGASGARMLVRKLLVVPGAFAEVRALALALLAEEGPRAAGDRRAFADALVVPASTPETRALARPTLRALVGDAARSADPGVKRLVARLVDHAGDPALRADLPGWPAVVRPRLAEVTRARRLSLGAADTGATPIRDAAYLPTGRLVVALDEAGVRVLGRDGRPLFHLDQPARRLVLSDRGDRALAVAPRGRDTLRLSRLDLVGRRSEGWCDAQLDVFADDFDGATWVVSRGDRLLLIDTLEPRFSALAELEPGGQVTVVGRSIASCTVVVSGPHALATRVRYELPAWFLRSRRPGDLESAVGPLHAVAAASGVAAAYLAQTVGEGAAPPLLIFAREGFEPRRVELPWPAGARPLAVGAGPGWVAAAVLTAAGVEVRLVDEEQLVPRCVIELGGAVHVVLRLTAETLTVADDRGRVLVMELEHGSVLHDARV